MRKVRAGEPAVYSFIRKHAKSPNGRRAIERVRREINPISYEELIRVTEIWADTALNLDERDLRMMDRLVRAQSRQIISIDSLPSRARIAG